MGHASYGNNSEQDAKVGEKPDPKAAGRKPEGGEDRPGFDLGGTQDRGGQAAPDRAAPDLPSAGPHADPKLTNEASTPGAGTLPEKGGSDEVDAASG